MLGRRAWKTCGDRKEDRARECKWTSVVQEAAGRRKPARDPAAGVGHRHGTAVMTSARQEKCLLVNFGERKIYLLFFLLSLADNVTT